MTPFGMLCLCLMLTDTPAATPASRLEDLRFIAGSWTTDPAGQRVSEEYWNQPKAGAMFANARTIRGEKTVFFEFLRIEQRADGVFFVAQPMGRPPTDFKLTSYDGKRAVFENPQHDFPTKIVYEQNGPDGLKASIEGQRNGKTMVESWDFSRMK